MKRPFKLAQYLNLASERMAAMVGSQVLGDPWLDPERCSAHVVSDKEYGSAATSNPEARAALGDTCCRDRRKGEGGGDV